MTTADRPLRIAHLTFSALPSTVGGLEIVVDNLIRHQMEAGHQPVLVTRWRQAKATRAAAFPYQVLGLPPNPNRGVDPFRFVGPRWPTALGVAWQQLRHRFDVWHVHWIFPTGWMAQRALDLTGAPMVLTAHGADIETDPESGHGFRLHEQNDARARQVMARARYLTAISDGIEQRYREAGVAKDKIARIANGVDFDRFQSLVVNPAALRAKYGLPSTGRMILTVGSNRPAKGHRFVPEALSRLRAAGHDVYWVILGGSPSAMAPLAEAAGVADRLFVISAVGNDDPESGPFPSDEVVAFYRAADLFSMPSLSEGFGMAALEAMAAGLPVIASNVGGLPSFVKDGENGLLVPPAETEALAAALGRVLALPDRGAKLGAAAAASAKDFDWRRISGQYLDLYRRATSERRE